MNCGEVHRSIQAWRKLSGVAMKPAIALKILRYTRLITAEWKDIEKLKMEAIRRAAGAPEGKSVTFESGSLEHAECISRIDGIMAVESTLPLLSFDLDSVILALDEKGNSLSVSDLAILEPFFQYPEPSEALPAEEAVA